MRSKLKSSLKIVLETFDLQREVPLLLSSSGNAMGLTDDLQVTLLERKANKKKGGSRMRKQENQRMEPFSTEGLP